MNQDPEKWTSINKKAFKRVVRGKEKGGDCLTSGEGRSYLRGGRRLCQLNGAKSETRREFHNLSYSTKNNITGGRPHLITIQRDCLKKKGSSTIMGVRGKGFFLISFWGNPKDSSSHSCRGKGTVPILQRRVKKKSFMDLLAKKRLDRKERL